MLRAQLVSESRGDPAGIQRLAIAGRRLLPRGWSSVLLALASGSSTLRRYPSRLANGTVLYLDLSQRMSHGLFFLRGQPHKFGTDKILRSLLRPGDTFIDVGANIGYYSVMAAGLVGPMGTVVAFEPQPAALAMLLANVAAQQADVKVVRVAVSDRVGSASFWVRPSGDTSSLLAGGPAERISVETETLDNACATLASVRLLKIDIEGSEPQVLRGARHTITRHRPSICFELLEPMVQSGQVSIGELASFFRELDYVCHWVDHTTSEALISSHRSQHVLATPVERVSESASRVVAAF